MRQTANNLIVSASEGIIAISLIIALFIGGGRVVAAAQGWD